MKTYITLSVLVLMTFNSVISANTRISTVGSNPYYSWIAYPQDILELPAFSISYRTSYQKLPWWGDIDEPANKPNATTYTTTGNEEIDGEARFKHGANIHSVDNQFGFTKRFRKNLMAVFDLNRCTFSLTIHDPDFPSSGELTIQFASFNETAHF